MADIPIAFCFDNNFSRQAAVTIESLLLAAKKDTFYRVYCIVSPDYEERNKEHFSGIDTHSNATLNFIRMSTVFQGCFETRGITSAAYYRMKLHELLPQESKIIYADVDILFMGDLSTVFDEVDLEGCLLAACKANGVLKGEFDRYLEQEAYWKKYLADTRKTYFNSGFLVMNLDLIRSSGIAEEWLEWSKEKLVYVDQDILNITCKGKVFFLHPKYNVTSGFSLIDDQEIYPRHMFEEALKDPVVIHYTGKKPWEDRHVDKAEVWWEFVQNSTGFYPFFKKRSMWNGKKLRGKFAKIITGFIPVRQWYRSLRKRIAERI